MELSLTYASIAGTDHGAGQPGSCRGPLTITGANTSLEQSEIHVKIISPQIIRILGNAIKTFLPGLC